MDRIWRAIEATIATCMAFVCAIAVFKLMAIFGEKKDFWDIATAVGTVGAAVVALWIALRQGRETRERELVKAHIVAARLLPRLSFALTEAVSAESSLAFFDDLEGRDLSYFRVILEKVRQIKVELQMDDLVALAVLPNRCGYRLANAMSIVELVELTMESHLPNLTNRPPKSEETMALASMVGDARIALLLVMEECQKAVGPLTEITVEERYGSLDEDDL